MTASGSRARPADFPLHLASAGFWLAAMTLQGFLIQWLLVFELEVDPWNSASAGP